MPNIEIIEENPLSLSEIKEKLQEVKKRDKEVIPKATKSDDYLTKFTKVSSKNESKIKEKLENSGITRLKPKHIKKLIDMQPKEIDSLKLLFSGENITFKQEDLNKLLTLLNEK